MPKYALQYVHYVTTTSLRSVVGAYMLTDATRQLEVVEVIMTGSGSDAAADIQHRCELAGYTFGATGVSTTTTPIPFNPAAAAAIGNYGSNYSTEPTTISAIHPVTFGFNQRGGMRWSVPQGEGFKTDGGQTGLSFGTLIISSTAGSVDGQTMWWEP